MDINAAHTTAPNAPINAPICTELIIKKAKFMLYTITKVTPKPAPAADPNKKGSAKGFLNTP